MLDSILNFIAVIPFFICLIIAVALFLFMKCSKRSSFSPHLPSGGTHSLDLNKYVGKEGIVIKDLRPVGNILIEGEQLEAVSQDTVVIPKGMGVEVIAVDDTNMLLVKVR